MPVLFTAEDDVFRMSPVVDVMVNPVNVMGAMGAGIAKEFKQRHPDMFDRYKELCDENKLQVGTLQIFQRPKLRYIIVNLPTKAHWIDDSDPEYIRKGLMALRRWLQRDGNTKFTVAMPMLGCGYGNLEQDNVKPIFEECLDDLPNVICVTQRPSTFPVLPKTLVVFGPRKFANLRLNNEVNPRYSEQLVYMTESIKTALSEWGLSVEDFYAFMSGGAQGTDTAFAGKCLGDETMTLSIGHKLIGDSKVKLVVAEADWDRWGKTAGMMRNKFMADVGTHFVGFLPPKITATGTESMIATLQELNTKLGETETNPNTSRFYKHVRIFGPEMNPANLKQISL